MSNCHKFACSILSLHSYGSSWPSPVLGHFHVISTKHNSETRSVRDGGERVEMCTICRVQKEIYFQIKELKITFHILPFSWWEKLIEFFSGLYYLMIRQWISVKIQWQYPRLSPSHTQAHAHTLVCCCLRGGRGCRAACQLCFIVPVKHTRLFKKRKIPHAQLSPVKWL